MEMQILCPCSRAFQACARQLFMQMGGWLSPVFWRRVNPFKTFPLERPLKSRYKRGSSGVTYWLLKK